jgi:hypothetical protein
MVGGYPLAECRNRQRGITEHIAAVAVATVIKLRRSEWSRGKLRQRYTRSKKIANFRNAKITDPGLSISPHQNVRRFDVTMRYRTRVSEDQAVQNAFANGIEESVPVCEATTFSACD